MKDRILRLAAELDGRFKCEYDGHGKIQVSRAVYKDGQWNFIPVTDLKSEWYNFAPRQECSWFDFKEGLRYIADQTNDFL